MRRRGAFVLLTALGWTPPVAAQSREAGEAAATQATIISVVQRYIDATMARDTAYLRAASLPHTTLVLRPHPATPQDTVITRSLDAFLAGVGAERRRWVGRVWNPTVTINDGIAVFIAPYDSWSDGRFTNCGMDHYILAYSAGRWRVSQLIYSRQLTGCTPSPLGPPR